MAGHVLQEYYENVMSESLAQAEQNDILYNRIKLGMWVWLVKTSVAKQIKKLLLHFRIKNDIELFITTRRPKKKKVAMEINQNKSRHLKKYIF